MSEESGNNNLMRLLDDALDDFKPPQKTTDDDLDDFMQKVDSEATQKAAENFQLMLGRMVDSLKKEEDSNPAGASSSKNTTTCNQSITKSISELLFSDTADENEITEALAKLPISNGSLDDLMETVLQTAVSKEAMYPAIKELHEKFQPYLEEKKDELSPETLNNYKEQYRILGQLLDLYAQETDNNVEGNKQSRASKIAALWMEMQKYGLPPPELSNNLHLSAATSTSEQFEKVDEKFNECSLM